MKNLLFVAAHKTFELNLSDPYRVIIVGSDKNQLTLPNAWNDNTGDNISKKNPHYCELTAQYWVWKNKLEYKNYGLCHYRRYFTKNRFSLNPNYFLNNLDIDRDLTHYDIILPTKHQWDKSVGKMYYEDGAGRKKDLQLVEIAIQEEYPEYLASFNYIMGLSECSYCNMFVMSKELFDEYSKWLFKILFYVEKRIDMTGYSVKEQRVLGYLSEMLLNVWVYHNNLKIKYYEVANTECSTWKQIASVLSKKRTIRKIWRIIRPLIKRKPKK